MNFARTKRRAGRRIRNITTVPWRLRLVLALLFAAAVVTVYVTNAVLTERFTQTTQQRAQLRLALYSGNLISELKRNAIVPRLLGSDPELIGALSSKDYQQTSQRLLSFLDEIGAAGFLLLDREGRVVAATDRGRLGEQHANAPFFVEAQRSNQTVFTATHMEGSQTEFAYSRRIVFNQQQLGVVVVEADLQKFEEAWKGIADAVIVTDSAGSIILATEATWLGKTEEAALARQGDQGALERALEATQAFGGFANSDTYLEGRAVMRQEARVPFQGWRMVLYTTYVGVRERVNTVIAIEIMAFTLLIAAVFFLMTRKSLARALRLQEESKDLRQLNNRLQLEIAERRKVEQTLQVAEQTLEQSSKLAALGEMSAAVSHELNQPLAAMKTYLAGAKLLLERRRPDEALASFHRIDSLIARMGAITRQLKSFARKAGENLVPLDMRGAVNGAIEIMEPQLKDRKIQFNTTLPSMPVMVMGDQLRLEQVIVNLLRNALDATSAITAPEIDVLLVVGDSVTLTVRDNGDGIKNLDDLFEPFYTTKSPGDGVGLGLAISSGIVTDMGGRLTARNAENGGAIFEVSLPAHS
ncbi:MAG: sensor histidine kinase [Planktomarina sp.]